MDVTNPRVFERPDSLGITAPRSHACRRMRPEANLIPDTHLAALAIEHGLILCSTDDDFGRFPGLRWRNPLRDWRDRLSGDERLQQKLCEISAQNLTQAGRPVLPGRFLCPNYPRDARQIGPDNRRFPRAQ